MSAHLSKSDFSPILPPTRGPKHESDSRLDLALSSPVAGKAQTSLYLHRSRVEESIRDGESPQARACRLATEKALSVAATLQDEVIVIGSDQVACLGDQIHHKPGTSEAAIAQLTASSGQTVQFWTAVSVWTSPGEPPTQRVVPCAVKMRILSNDEISRYVTLDHPLDCAGSFKWESLGITLFETLRTEDPTALE